jgi:hypothetical protein
VIEQPGERTDYEAEDDDEDDAQKAEDWPVIIGQLLELDATLLSWDTSWQAHLY